MYTPAVTEAEAKAAGFELSDYAEEEPVEIWPEHLPAFQMLQRIGTRWAHGMAGPVGIRWESVYPLMDRLGLSRDAWDALLEDLEVMEGAALRAMHTKR